MLRLQLRNTLLGLTEIVFFSSCSASIAEGEVDESLLVELALQLKLQYHQYCTIVNMG